jgi:rubrerythrin
MVRICGRDYFWIPLTVVPVVAVVVWMAPYDTPFLVFDFVSIYAFVLLFTMTGAVLRAHDVTSEIDIELPLEPTESELHDDLIGERQRVANHAYGFISRGNREGGFAHIRAWLQQEANRDEAYQWFFLEMLKWESSVPALFFAQEFLRQLLKWDMDREALKLISRCLHEDPQWRPQQDERADVQDLLDRHGREDLIRKLKR